MGLVSEPNDETEFGVGSPGFENGRSAFDSPSAPTFASGKVFGKKFKFLQRIGRGGMGDVWLADQFEPLKRRVAIKLLREDSAGQESVSRFLLERQTLAMLNHPNIAKIFDCGIDVESTQSSPNENVVRPFFVMEWIPGVPLHDYCRQKRLNIEQRIRILIPVCMAVSHAHQKGVVHRDLKPSNILVANYDEQPVAKIIDFGVAKVEAARLLEQSPFTQIGSMIGTLEYMSPEQAEPTNWDVDTRTDIYSLGVILYQLMTDSLPFCRTENAKSLNEVIRAIMHDEPLRPSIRVLDAVNSQQKLNAQDRWFDPKQWRHQLRGDLDWIIMRCLEKDRSRRYANAGDLATDLNRFLRGEAVDAHPPTLRYRLSKQLKRNWAWVATSAGLLALLIAGIIGTSRGMYLAYESTALAVARAKSLQVERDRAKELQAEALTQAGVARAVREFLQYDLLGQANVYFQVKSANADPSLAGKLLPDPTIRQMLERVSQRFENGKFDPRLTPEVHAELLEVIGNTFRGLGVYDRGIEFLNRSRELYRQCYGDHDTRFLRCETLTGRVLIQQGKASEAIELLQHSTVGLVANEGEYSTAAFDAQSTLAWGLRAAGRASESITISEEMVKRWENRTDAPPNLLGILDDLSWAYKDLGRVDEALSISRRIVPKMEETFGFDHPTTLTGLHHLSSLLSFKGDLQAAVKVNERAKEGRTKVFGPGHPETLWTMHTLTELLLGVDRIEEALAMAKETAERRIERLGPEHPHTLSSQFLLGQCLTRSGQVQEALTILIALETRLEKDQPASNRRRDTLQAIIELLKKLDQSAEEYQSKLDRLPAVRPDPARS